MRKRLISVALTLPFYLLIMFNDRLISLFHLCILSLSIVSSLEIFNMAQISKNSIRTVIATIISISFAYIYIITGNDLFSADLSKLFKMITYQDINLSSSLIVIFASITILFSLNMFKLNVSFEEKGRAIFTAIFCFMYVGVGVWHITLLRFFPAGEYLIIFILLCAWISDTGGYVVGRKIGKHKLSNSASPNKSVEGLVGMFLFTIPFTILYYFLYSNGYLKYLLGDTTPSYSLTTLIILSIILTITSFIGDMGESLIKRMYHTKDSSSMFPGHGGVFDMFDSVILTAPIAYYIFLYLL